MAALFERLSGRTTEISEAVVRRCAAEIPFYRGLPAATLDRGTRLGGGGGAAVPAHLPAGSAGRAAGAAGDGPAVRRVRTQPCPYRRRPAHPPQHPGLPAAQGGRADRA